MGKAMKAKRVAAAPAMKAMKAKRVAAASAMKAMKAKRVAAAPAMKAMKACAVANYSQGRLHCMCLPSHVAFGHRPTVLTGSRGARPTIFGKLRVLFGGIVLYSPILHIL